MHPSSLLGCTVLIVFLTQLEAAKDSGQIEQCQCDELMNCRKEAKENETPCIEKCRGRLNHKDWNKEQGLKCFDQPENKEHHECMHTIALDTCANEPGIMINKNETLHWGHRRHHHRRSRAINGSENELNDEKHEESDHEDEQTPARHEQHRPREHNRRAFHTFIRKHFGKSGKLI
jgi:hypothetical protein